jgi:hypothetical protein
MARGWDSKGVEEQIEQSVLNREFVSATKKQPRTADQVQRSIEKRSLEAARAKVRHEIESTHNERYQAMLTRSLQDLDSKLAKLEN